MSSGRDAGTDSFSLSSQSISFSTLDTAVEEEGSKQRLVDALIACGCQSPFAVQFAADVETLQELAEKARQQHGPPPKGVETWGDVLSVLRRRQWTEKLAHRWPKVDKRLHEELVESMQSSSEFEAKYQQMQLDDAKFAHGQGLFSDAAKRYEDLISQKESRGQVVPWQLLQACGEMYFQLQSYKRARYYVDRALLTVQQQNTGDKVSPHWNITRHIENTHRSSCMHRPV